MFDFVLRFGRGCGGGGGGGDDGRDDGVVGKLMWVNSN